MRAPWADERPGAHVVRAAKFALWTQVEAGHGCPISMTYSIIPALRADAEVAGRVGAAAHVAPPTTRPAAGRRPKRGATAGMAMTEKQGGSDVRANTTRAEPVGRRGEEYASPGTSGSARPPERPVPDARPGAGWPHLLRHAALAPRRHPQRHRVERLKDKLGNRSNASSEIELDGAWAQAVGDEGAGVPTIIRWSTTPGSTA
jgi:putative acyl-CoA dehydrogenase